MKLKNHEKKPSRSFRESEFWKTRWWSFCYYRKSSIKPPLFRGRKLIRPSPPFPLPSILVLRKQQTKLTWTDHLWFIQAGNSYCFWSSAAWRQLHVLNFFNFTLLFSEENCYHFLIVRKSSIAPGNHKSVLEKPCCPLMHFAKLNKPPYLLSPHPLLSPPPLLLKSAWKK